MNKTFYEETDDMMIDFRELFLVLKKNCLLVLAVTLLAGCISCVYTKFFVSPVYTSTASMMVLTKETTASSLSDIQMGSQLTNDYEVLITSRLVLEEVIENLNLDMEYGDLRELIVVENPPDTRILKISVNYDNAVMAKTIVNELAVVSSEAIGDIVEGVPPKIIEEGEVPIYKTSPSMIKNAVIGLLAGFFLSGGILIVLTVLDDTIKSEEDVTKFLGLSTLAVIPDRKDYITGKSRKKQKARKKEMYKGEK